MSVPFYAYYELFCNLNFEYSASHTNICAVNINSKVIVHALYTSHVL